MKITRTLGAVINGLTIKGLSLTSTFDLTAEEKEGIYREVQTSYRTHDAARQLDFYIQSNTDCAGSGKDEYTVFAEVYGISYEDACNEQHPHYLLDSIVQVYEGSLDCNCDENSLWEAAIASVLADILPTKREVPKEC